MLEAAKALFAEVGIDAPMRDIAARAGVGVGTIYRNYPQRSDLIIAVFRREVDATAVEAERLSGEYPPPEALRLWTASFASFVATKRGLAGALHSGDPAYRPLPNYFVGTLAPKVQSILDAGAQAGSIRSDVRADDVIFALSRLAQDVPPVTGDGAVQMTEVLLDGLFVVA